MTEVDRRLAGILLKDLHFTQTTQTGRHAQAVRVVHTPTGVEATCLSESSTYRNRSVAVQMVALGLRLLRRPM